MENTPNYSSRTNRIWGEPKGKPHPIKNLVTATALVSALSGAIWFGEKRTPLTYEGLNYKGYSFEKAEGIEYAIFESRNESLRPSEMTIPEGDDVITFKVADRNFNCDDAYHKKRDYNGTSGRFNVYGYRNLLEGNVATNLVPIMDSDLRYSGSYGIK